jgi:hypothetical protein
VNHKICPSSLFRFCFDRPTDGDDAPDGFRFINAAGAELERFFIFGLSRQSASYLFVSGDNLELAVLPEPGTWAMLFSGFLLLAHHLRRKARTGIEG